MLYFKPSKLLILSLLIIFVLINGVIAITSIISSTSTIVDKETEFYNVKFNYDNKTKEASNIELISKKDSISKEQKNSLFDMIEAYALEKEKYEAEIKPSIEPTAEPTDIKR